MERAVCRDNINHEILDGRIFYMAPRPAVKHNFVITNIGGIFYPFLKGKKCQMFSDGVDVFLTKKDRVVPDFMIVCNRDIIKSDGIHGSPDLIIEVLSPGTARKDKGYKKDLYEKCGVKEYWIISPEEKSIEVYLLNPEENRYMLDNVYSIFPDFMIERMIEENIDIDTEVIKEFKTSLYDDLIIKVEDVFYNMDFEDKI